MLKSGLMREYREQHNAVAKEEPIKSYKRKEVSFSGLRIFAFSILIFLASIGLAALLDQDSRESLFQLFLKMPVQIQDFLGI